MPKIGIEIHGYLLTNEKLFCRCKSVHGSKLTNPNVNICPICTGQPGSKPMLPNKTAIDNLLKIALVLNCKINKEVVWKRKHYDWPDLPKGFQNTISGAHSIPNAVNGEFLGIRIREVHLEEDPAAWNPKTGEIDYNRSGSPLIEIVTEPDFVSSEQVVEWIKQLRVMLSYIKAIDKNSGIKADVNISLPEKKGERVEVKNINSITNIKNAIDFEILRQNKKGELPKIQETRRYDDINGITIMMRTKENAEDYRFISEPDLPCLIIAKKRIELIKNLIPETPQIKLKKLIERYKIDKKHAEILTRNIDIVEFFEKIIEKSNPSLAVRWVIEELQSVLNYNKKELDEINLDARHFIELLELIEKQKITELKAKEILRSFINGSYSPKEKLKEHLVISETEIKKIVERVISENKKAVEDYKKGKKESLNFLVGKVMHFSDKRADFKKTKEMIEKILNRPGGN